MSESYNSSEDFFWVLQDTETAEFVSEISPVKTVTKIGWAAHYSLSADAATARFDSLGDDRRYQVREVGYQFLD